MPQDGPVRVENSDVEVRDEHEDPPVLVCSAQPDVMQLGAVVQSHRAVGVDPIPTNLGAR